MKYSLLFLFLNSYFIYSIGWEKPFLLAPKVERYHLVQANNKIYILTSQFQKPFVANEKNVVDLKLYQVYKGRGRLLSKVISIPIPANNTYLPLLATLGVANKDFFISWQESNLAQGGTSIYYLYSNAGPTFNIEKKLLPYVNTQYTPLAPRIYQDRSNQFYLIYQEEIKKNLYTLKLIKVKNGKIKKPTIISKNFSHLGFGIFFPSVVFQGDVMNIFYQNRYQRIRKDEIFHIVSKNKGNSFSKPIRITTNNYNDFSPSAMGYDFGLEWVWQANLDIDWVIMYQNSNGERLQLTPNKVNAYLPSIVRLKNKGRIVAWVDYRDTPAQIYGKFLDQKDNDALYQTHNITKSKVLTHSPKLMYSHGVAYLFYKVGNSLYVREVDQYTQDLVISSRTHPLNSVQKITTAELTWKLPIDASEVKQFAYIQDSNPNTNPDLFNISPFQRRIHIYDLPGGKHYFHLRYVDKAGNLSKTTHFPIFVDLETPSTPEIIEPKIADQVYVTKKSEFTIRFLSEDDTEISHYKYAVSLNRLARLNKKTQYNFIKIENLEPNTYYFRVQAVDKAGNISSIKTLRLEILAAENDLFQISNNIEDQTLTDEVLKFSISYPNIEEGFQVYLALSNQKVNPYTKGKKLTVQKSLSNLESFSKKQVQLQLSNLSKNRLYIASLGIIKNNGTKKKIRYYYFEYGTPTSIRVLPKKYTSYGPVKIDFSPVDINKNLFKTRFEVQKRLVPFLKGFVWQVSHKPILPTSKVINSSGNDEYLYNLDSGVYYLSVKPIFTKASLNTEDNYSYLKFMVEQKNPLLSNQIILNIVIIIFVVFLFVYLYRLRIHFYMSKIISSLKKKPYEA